MKSKKQKQDEAYVRLQSSVYTNSRACRKGIPEEVWAEKKRKMLSELVAPINLTT